jgi:hypothetical protein
MANKSLQQHHYYATTAFGWACRDTKEEAIRSIARAAGAKTIKLNREKKGGLFCQVCRVDLPLAAHYTINQYLPHLITKEDGIHETRKGEVVPISEVESLRITTVTGKTIPVSP